MAPPDYCEPTLGWRVWDVVELDGALRLRSPAFLTIWFPHGETAARCNRSFPTLYALGLGGHSAPHERCSCGVYASKRVEDATRYLSRLFPRRPHGLHRVIGRASLWGTVVECERGWRASRAYPALLYVPRAEGHRLSLLTKLPRPSLPAETIALALADYGVPVEITDWATTRQVVRALGRPESGVATQPVAPAASRG